MMKKIIYGLLALVLVCGLAGAVVWQLKGSQWREEYAAYRKTGAPILMYHAVGTEYGKDWPKSLIMPPQLFEEHLKYLKEQGYTIVSVEQLAHRLEKKQTVDKYIALSFDDGYKDNYSNALPIMQKYDAKGSFFVINKDNILFIFTDILNNTYICGQNRSFRSHCLNHCNRTAFNIG